MRRGIGAAAGAAALALVLGGCLPWLGNPMENMGLMAMTRDEQGAIVASVHMCSGHVDGVTVWDASGDTGTDIGQWEFPKPVTGTAELRLDGLEDSLPPGDLQVYSFASSQDNVASANGPSFRASNLAPLKPGTFWAADVATPSDPDKDYPMRQMTASEWEASARAFCSIG